MKKIMLATTVVIAAVSGIIGYYNQSPNQQLGALALANVEALSKNENNGCEEEKCSRASQTANCYKLNGDWQCMRIVSVYEYTRSSCMEICYHDHVTNCPAGTTER